MDGDDEFVTGSDLEEQRKTKRHRHITGRDSNWVPTEYVTGP